MHNGKMMNFNSAVERLRQAHLSLDSYLSRTNVVSHLIRREAGLGASDILIQCSILREAHILSNAPVSVLKEHPLASAQFIKRGYVSSVGPDSRLKVAYKALFYFVRAYQDALYKALFQVEAGRRPRKYASMTNAIDENKENYRTHDAVGSVLAYAYPEYLGWFLYWRNKRNAVKVGAGFSITGGTEGIGITFETVTENGGTMTDLSGAQSVGIADAAQAIETSARLAILCLERTKMKTS